MRSNERQVNLKGWVEEILSREHTNLGRKTIDGIVCEGIETRYAVLGDASPPAQNHVSRVWVAVETGYPVLCEGESLGDDGQLRNKTVLDQFQWDVRLDASEFEPTIPEGYEQM
jgi:outer membrane lipoprotein-sorting protein